METMVMALPSPIHSHPMSEVDTPLHSLLSDFHRYADLRITILPPARHRTGDVTRLAQLATKYYQGGPRRFALLGGLANQL